MQKLQLSRGNLLTNYITNKWTKQRYIQATTYQAWHNSLTFLQLFMILLYPWHIQHWVSVSKRSTSHSTNYRSFRDSFHRPDDVTSVSEWVSRGLTSHSTLHRSFRGRFLQARWPNQQRQSTEGNQLATEIGFSPTRSTPLCYNMNCRQPPLG